MKKENKIGIFESAIIKKSGVKREIKNNNTFNSNELLRRCDVVINYLKTGVFKDDK
jgi:hypothetical protein